jgi:hypothetical protein
LQSSGLGGLHTVPGLQPQVRSESGLKVATGAVFVGLGQVVIDSMTVVVIVLGGITVVTVVVKVVPDSTEVITEVIVDAGRVITVGGSCVVTVTGEVVVRT